MSVTVKNPIGKLGLGTSQIGQMYVGGQLMYTAQTPDNPSVLQLGLDTQPSVTGGWLVKTAGENWYFREYNQSTQSIRLAQKGLSGNNYGYAVTAAKVNVSGWKKLVLRAQTYQGYGDADKSNGWIYVGLADSDLPPMTGEGVFTDTVVRGKSYFSTNKKITEYYLEVDVADLEGDFYIFAGQRRSHPTATYHCYLQDIYFTE